MMSRRKLIAITLALLVGAGLKVPAARNAQAANSILLKGGTVVDGTGGRRYQADVRIVGDEIGAIGQLAPLAGEREIDARGLVIAPGFIDTLMRGMFSS